MKVNPIEPIRKQFFVLRHNKPSLIDVQTGKETPYKTVTEAWEAKERLENGVDILV